MIAACPSCGARYRIDAARVRPEGARLRCTRCETIFRVEGSVAAAPSVPEAPPPPPRTSPAAQPGGARTAERGPAEAGSPVRDRTRLVLVASPEEDAGKRLVNVLSSWGLETILVSDGVEAILNIQRALPRAVVLDAALPKMFGFQVCELMKRNESLREIAVVLIGAIHDQERYRRPPGELYGADAYAERHQLPDALRPILARFGLPVGAPQEPAAARATSAPPRPSERSAARAPQAPGQPGASAPTPGGAAPSEREKAERLARIIVSDIVLYNQEKFDAAVRAGNVLKALASELAEGHALFAARVDASVGDAQEFLKRELLRLARSRGMK